MNIRETVRNFVNSVVEFLSDDSYDYPEVSDEKGLSTLYTGDDPHPATPTPTPPPAESF